MIPRPNRRTGTYKNCTQCTTEFYARKCESKKRFCSTTCFDNSRRKYIKEIVPCKTCDKFFIKSEKPHSNSSGKFCSRICYDKSLVGQYRGKPIDGKIRSTPSRWKAIRTNHMNKNNEFCCQCGKRDCKLQVHHIDPVRTSNNNEPWNLITLCPKCHSAHENKISSLIKNKHQNVRQHMVMYVQSFMHDLWHIHQGRYLKNGNS